MAIQALVMGFGGTGAHILTYLKEIAVLKHGKKPDSLKFLLFDTIAGWAPGKTVQIIGGVGEETLAAGHEEGTSLDNVSEYFYLQDQHPSLHDYVYQLLAEGATSVNDYPHLKDWLHTPWLGQRIPKDRLNVKDGAAQQRQIGRFAMFQNVQAIVSHLERALHELQSQAHGATISVWLIGSAAGGTGAGSLLDAAFMTRLVAARLNVGIQVSGVIVLPSIYAEKPGISDARAYSLFRELDRFQEVGFGTHKNRYLVNNRQVSSEVSYDATGQHRALVEAKLFDNLFYLGTSCRNDSDREAFFSSVANALDPYLDEGQGRELLQNSINEIGFAASSFGAARLYVPQETYAELFAWKEVREFLKAMTAPKEEGKQVTDVYAGEKADRQAGATTKVKNLLPLFEELLKLKGKTSEQISGFAKNTLDPQTMVTQWYQLGAVGIIDMQKTSPAELQKTVLAYTNPYFSLREAHRERVAIADIEVKTYKEYQKAGRPTKEDQTTSRDRFAQELSQRTERYKQTGQGTFEEGRQFILKVLSNHLAGKIDTLIQEEFARFPQVAWDHASPSAGTVITRLYQELREAVTPGGPLETISSIITTFLNVLDAEENLRSHQVVNEVNTLRNRNPTFADKLRTWVEEPQVNAREQCAKYIQWYQKRGLLKDLQILVQQVQQRFVEWAEAFRRVLEDLALSVPNRLSALEETNLQHLSRLQGRLYRLARNRSALISCEPDMPGGGRDETMQGYREELRRYAVGEGEKRLAYQLLTQARWQLKRDRGTPQVELVVKLGDTERTFSSGQSLRRLHQDLHNYFRQFVDNELGKRDIFDYLLYAQNQRNVSPAQIARLLDGACAVLLTTSGTVSTVSWVYNNPKEPSKTNFITSLGVELTKIHSKTDQSEKNIYSDRQSLTLLKIAKPAPSEVINIAKCREVYVNEQMETVSGNFKHDEALYRAQVYHPFRAELEAWYIERRQAKWLTSDTTDEISPRLTRLLEHPDMMQAFVYCIATKVVEKDSQRQIWVFHNAVLNKDLELTTTEESTADVVRAAVVFVLRQQEGKPRSTVKITFEHAMQSATSAAQREGKNREDLVEAFVGKPNGAERTPLDDFLDNNEYFRQFKDDGSLLELADREKRNMKMIFQFYGDRKRRTQLGDRMELP